MPPPKLFLFGEPRIETAEGITVLENSKPVQLLCFLGCQTEQVANTDVIQALWSTNSRADGENLKSLKTSARSILAAAHPTDRYHFLPRGEHGWSLLTNLESDASTFRRLVDGARIGDAQKRLDSLCEAREFYRDNIEGREFLEGRHWSWKPALQALFNELIEFVTESQLAQPAPSSKLLWTVPYTGNPFFTGRAENIAGLRAMLTTERRSALARAVCIVGEGGKGKTELALQYCYAFRGQYDHVLWLNADTHASLQADLLRAYRSQFGYEDGLDHSPESDLLRAARMRDRLRDLPSCLVVLDNADVPDAMVRFEEEALPDNRFLKPILALQSAHVLVTSRKAYWGDLANPIQLDTLSTEDGALMFLKRARSNADAPSLGDFSEPDQVAATTFCIEVDGFALALDQAGITCREYNWSPARYLEEFRRRFSELVGTRNLSDRHEKAVLATVQTSLEQIDQSCPQAGALIRWCAHLPPDAIPQELFAVVEGDVAHSLKGVPLEKAVQVARDQSLLQADPERQSYRMHRLVQRVVRLIDSGSDEGGPERYDMLAHAALFADPGAEARMWSRAERLAPIWRHIGIYGPDTELVIQALNRLGEHGLAATASPSTLQDCQLAVQKSIRAFGKVHAETCRSELNLCATLVHLGHFEEALHVARELVKSQTALHGPYHTNTIEALRLVGGAYYGLGRVEDACDLYESTLNTVRKADGDENPQAIKSLVDLANAYELAGRDVEALKMFKQAVALQSVNLGESHTETLATMNQTANSYWRLKQFDEAEAWHELVLDLRRRSLGAGHPDTQMTMNNLVTVRLDQGNLKEALVLTLHLIELRKETFGDAHPMTLLAEHKLALILWRFGRKREASELETKVLNGFEASLGRKHEYPLRSRAILESWLQSERDSVQLS